MYRARPRGHLEVSGIQGSWIQWAWNVFRWQNPHSGILTPTCNNSETTERKKYMPKFIGHYEHKENIHINDADSTTRKHLMRIKYSHKVRLNQSMVYYCMDTSDRGGPKSLAKRWNRWYALPENVACHPNATEAMRRNALPKCHLTF